MDKQDLKYDMVLDIIEHPDKFTPEELTEMLSDPEAREIYNFICMTDSAAKASGRIDIESEWRSFSDKRPAGSRRPFIWLGSRAATIAAIVSTSLVAVAAGIAVTMSVINHKPATHEDSSLRATSSVVLPSDTTKNQIDSIKSELKPIIFENEPLEAIMQAVAKAYGVKVRFNSKDAAALHLFYKFDPTLSIDEIVEQLNTFERINIKRTDDTLTID